MRFFHLADLHIGKRLNSFSLLPDQQHILGQIIELAQAHQPDAILICGDIYDKTTPTAEAVAVFDQFLTHLSYLKKPVFIISGNHDSPERLNFAAKIISRQNIYLAGIFEGTMPSIILHDQYGEIVFHLLPFIRPAQVRRFFPDQQIESYEDAVRCILDTARLCNDKRQVLLAHQFITAGGRSPERSESEQISIGTLDSIDSAVFDGYDYVALGHIHRAQMIGGEHIRYAGSPLKYSFSEALHHKAITMVELKTKGDLTISQIPLLPLHDLRQLQGPLEQLIKAGLEDRCGYDDYLHITLTDEQDLIDPFSALQHIYPNLMKLDFSGKRYQSAEGDALVQDLQAKTPLELFAEFYQLQQNINPDEDKLRLVRELLAEIGGEA